MNTKATKDMWQKELLSKIGMQSQLAAVTVFLETLACTSIAVGAVMV